MKPAYEAGWRTDVLPAIWMDLYFDIKRLFTRYPGFSTCVNFYRPV